MEIAPPRRSRATVLDAAMPPDGDALDAHADQDPVGHRAARNVARYMLGVQLG
jgi:hypothetical protein